MRQKDIAQALGISEGQVSRLAKRGMPTDDVERARRWRRRHLESARTADRRPDYRAQRVARTIQQHDLAARDFARLMSLADSAALSLRDTGRLPDELESALRAELRAVPGADREDVVLPAAVFEHLTRDVFAAIDASFAELGEAERVEEARQRETESPADRAWWRQFVYAAAAGEVMPGSQPILL